MNSSTTLIKEEARVERTASAELSRVGSTAFVFSATAIGCWAMVALFAGATNGGGPLELLRALVTAITG